MRVLMLLAVLMVGCASEPPKPFVPGDYAATPYGCLEARERAAAKGEPAPC